MHWRLGLDLGTNSIGWWAVRVTKEESNQKAPWQAVESIDGGVRIFSDGREPAKGGRVGDSRAVARRLARGIRRNRDHGRNRMRRLVDDLIELGLLPENPGARDALFQSTSKSKGNPDRYNPYRLRAEALERPLTPHELGRALQHLGLRRGYKSNRKESSDDDGGKLRGRITALRARLNGHTLGQHLWETYQREKLKSVPAGVRFRAEDDTYPDRALYAAEFDAIRAVQEPHHVLTAKDWDRLRNERILFQWPLRSVERGRCEFFPDSRRHWRDTPIGHDFRIFQELNELRWIDAQEERHALDAEQRASVLDLLMRRASEVKFKSMRSQRRVDGMPLFPAGSRFNLEGEKRKGLKPHTIAVRLRREPLLMPLWEARQSGDGGRLDDVFESLQASHDNDELQQELVTKHGLDNESAATLVGLQLGAQTASVSRRFMELIVPVLRDQGLIYSDAVAKLRDENGKSLHHSLREDDRRWSRLPYYGEVLASSMLGSDPSADPDTQPEQRFGRINNQTVHVSLNQLRKVVNALVDRLGSAPVEIHVELTRALKQSRQRRNEENRRQAAEEKRNQEIKKQYERLGIHEPSARDIKKFKLWEELGEERQRRCVFSGEVISEEELLFNGEAEIEHLLPFSRTLDNSMANLTVSLRWANRLKGKHTPYEAFANGRCANQGFVWDEILERAKGLPDNKRWRFGSDAMVRYEHEGRFIARQLPDTAYISRVAQQYLRSLEGVCQVVPHRGGLTALVRGKWDLSGLLSDDKRKSRKDHRHHAVDAAVIALTDRSVLTEVSRLSGRGADDVTRLAVPDLDPKILAAIRARVPQIVVSYKPDHGLRGQMYAETAYGYVPPERRDPSLLEHEWVVRKALTDLSEKECETIRDRNLRDVVRNYLQQHKANGLKKALAKFAKEYGVRHVRILVKNQTISPVASAPYKGYAPVSYVCCDVWRVPKGHERGEFKGVFWSYAETADGQAPDKATKKPHPAARFVARLFKDDMVAYEEGGRTSIARVAGFSTTNNRLDIRPHHLAVSEQSYVGINVLGAKRLRKIRVSPGGLVFGVEGETIS